MDSNFHELHELVQPPPFLELKGDFAQINGRGYPMTTFENQADMSKADNSPSLSQQLHSVVRASVGERVLLRVTNGSVDSVLHAHRPRPADEGGGPRCADRARAVGRRGRQLGARDRLDHAGRRRRHRRVDRHAVLAAGTYYLYTTNLNLLSNGASEDRGGLMTTFVLQ